MAMEGDRRTAQNPTPKSQGGYRRIDARHSHGNVPVLFRLKNLQKVNAADSANGANPTKFDADSSPRLSSSREPNRAENSVVAPHANRTDVRSKAEGASVASITNATAKPDPVTTPGKHGVSNGVILLVALVAIAFSIGKKMGGSNAARPASSSSSASVATVPSTTAATTIASAETTKSNAVTPPSSSPEPLVVPTLPALAKEEAPDSTESSSETKPKIASTKTDEGLLTLEMGMSSKEKEDSPKANAETLSAPLTLVSEANASNASEAKSSASSTETASTEKLSQKESVTAPTNVQAESSNAASPSPTVLTTKTPHTDLESMFQIRANYQSQAAALAKMRQSPPSTGPQTNVAGYQPTYQTPNSVAPSINQMNAQLGSVPAQPVGYGGQERPASPAPQNFSMPTTTTANPTPYAGPVATLPSYAQPQYPTGAPSQSTGNATFAQPANQPYVPIYQSPNPSQPNTSGGYAAPAPPTPYVPIGNQFNPEGYAN